MNDKKQLLVFVFVLRNKLKGGRLKLNGVRSAASLLFRQVAYHAGQSVHNHMSLIWVVWFEQSDVLWPDIRVNTKYLYNL